jgi:rubrerythrin
MKKTTNMFNDEINDKFKGKIVVLDSYINQRTKINFHCNECGLNFCTTPQSILHTTYGCPNCANTALKKALLKSHRNSIYGKLIDEYPNISKQWDFNKNVDIDINDISSKSGQRVWWICSHCGESYQAKVCAIVNGSGKCICSTCYRKLLPQIKVDSYVQSKGSFAEHYPQLLREWCYELNIDIEPTKLTDSSNKKVWWTCQVCGHQWKAKIAKRTAGEGCPYCARHTKSSLQIKIEDYVRTRYDYQLLNEHNCVLICYNPNTGYRLLYDNEIIINNDTRLVVECHGEQHYRVCGWTYTQAKAEHCSPQEILTYQQWKDEYKKQYALDNGYYYLAIPYTAEKDDQYKQLIDDKIHEILTLSQQNECI